MKTLGKVLGVVAVLVIAIAIVILMNLDKGIKTAVETLGPDMTQSEVTLEKVDLSLMSGSGSLGGLVIGNPQGFDTDTAFSLGEISFDLDTDSLKTDTIVVKSLRIVAPEITLEQGKGSSNLQQIQKNIESYLGSSNENTASEEASSQKLVIRDLRISEGKVHYSNALLGAETIDVALPDIHMTNIGNSGEGASPAEVAGEVVNAITSSAGQAVIGVGGAIKDVGDQVEEQLKEKAGKLKGLLGR